MSETTEINLNGERAIVTTELLDKYNQPGPRYTSYPTAPEWHNDFGVADFQQAIAESHERNSPLSLYFHLPFCQSLCLYCGCNVVISKKQEVAAPYLEHLKHEIDQMRSRIAPGRIVRQLHWGGGTPTFLTAEQIEDL
ncbi:MAG TPA: coproporphyrinogen III oxidase, partial [Blastocatellia bacterium]|nr:coproporphyrinogen III oxidase [Blastocatellia bacterium]